MAQWSGTQEVDSLPGNTEWKVSHLWASTHCVAEKGKGKVPMAPPFCKYLRHEQKLSCDRTKADL